MVTGACAVTVGLILSSAFPAIIVFAQELMPAGVALPVIASASEATQGQQGELSRDESPRPLGCFASGSQ